MKTFKLTTVALLSIFVIQGIAQTKLAGGFDHIIDVAQISYYGKGYLTITDAHLIYDPCNKDFVYNLTFDYVEKDDDNYGLGIGDIIVEVDGVSAKGWTPEDFYKTVDGKDDVLLKIKGYNQKEDGKREIVEHTMRIRPLFDLPNELKIFGDSFKKSYLYDQSISKKRKAEYDRVGGIFEKRIDKDFDFFPCISYDYLITSSDPLLDKEILENIEIDWKRDEEYPDLLITIAKSADESVATTYVPPTSRTVNTGSTTKARYNHITKKYDYVTTQYNNTIRERGYVNETKTADLYLEISALDVKQLNDPESVSPPIVWQTISKWHVTNYSFNVNEMLKLFATWVKSPLFDLMISWNDKVIYAPLGIVCSEISPNVIQSVVKGSKAEAEGLLPGDKLVRAKYRGYWGGKIKNITRHNWKEIPDDKVVNIRIQRDGKKLDFELEPASIKVWHHYLSVEK